MHRFLLFCALVAALSTFRPAAAQDVRFSESFDTVTEPDLPPDWSGDWATSTSSSSDGSGLNNLADTGTGAASATSAAFSLTGASGAVITYRARRTSSYPAEALSVLFVTSEGEFAAVGAGLPSASGSWEPVELTVPAQVLGSASVRIRFLSSGGSASGSNARIDDLEVTLTDAAPTGGQVGFAATQTDALAASTGVLIPLDLTWNGTEPLQGLQFELTSDDPSVSLTGFQRGAALSNQSDWTLTREGAQGLVLSNTAGGLAAGSYEPLLWAVVDVGETIDTLRVTLRLEGVIGAVAVPSGDDAGLVTLPGETTLRVLPRIGIFQAPDSLDLGAVPVGSSSSEGLWIRNVGAGGLVLTAIAADHAAFSVQPASGLVASGDSLQVLVTFAPGVEHLGDQTGHLLVDGLARTALTGTGLAAWGDATDDGLVDVGDIVLGVDVALGRVSASQEVVASLDLYPFPEGDGAVDVRDLTVLTQAVLRGEWPGSVPLPEGSAGKAWAVAADPPVQIVQAGEEVVAVIAKGVRGLQADLQVEGTAARTGEALLQQSERHVRLVWVRMDGSDLPEGSHVVALAGGAVLTGGVAIGAIGERYPLGPPELPDDTGLAPHPNPFSPLRHGSVAIPGAPTFTIVDLLGRVVRKGRRTWDGTDGTGGPAAPGVYLVRAGSITHRLVVVR